VGSSNFFSPHKSKNGTPKKTSKENTREALTLLVIQANKIIITIMDEVGGDIIDYKTSFIMITRPDLTTTAQ